MKVIPYAIGSKNGKEHESNDTRRKDNTPIVIIAGSVISHIHIKVNYYEDLPLEKPHFFGL
jgi:hypothetical protein